MQKIFFETLFTHFSENIVIKKLIVFAINLQYENSVFNTVLKMINQ